MAHGNKPLYNYLVNTLGISKQMVVEYIDHRLSDIVEKHLKSILESNRLRDIILFGITRIVDEGFAFRPVGYAYSYKKEAFDEYVKKLLRAVIEQRVKESFDLEVKIVPKDSSVIRKA